jgi:tRNA(Ile)-lysidine synthase
MSSMAIDHSIISLDWSEDEKQHRSQFMTLAREKRYEKLAQYCRKQTIHHVMTGHHMNDQLETFLMRFGRESGVDGWACMKPISDYPVACVNAYKLSLKLIRPFLNVRKECLIELCKTHQIPWTEDPTNRNLDYQRNRIRFTLGALTLSGVTLERFHDMIHQFQRYKKEHAQKGNQLLYI